MHIILFCAIFLLPFCIYSDDGVQLLFPESEEELEKWLDLGKPKGFIELPPKTTIEMPLQKIPVPEVIVTTLEKQWNVQIAKSNVLKQSGLTLASKGPFDPLWINKYSHQWLADVQVPAYKTDLDGFSNDALMSLEKLTRLGTRFSLNCEIDQVFNPSLLFGNPYNRTNVTTATFSIEQPLLKRLQYNPESVDEMVNEIKLKAVKNELIQIMAQNVRDALQVYWDLAATQKIVTINENSKKILEVLASATEELQKGERIAASELNEQFAEIARSNRDLLASEQDLYRLYNNLLFEMGIDRKTFSLDLPNLMLDDFPTTDTVKDEWNLGNLLDISMQCRGDLLAAQDRIEETKIQFRLAKQNMYPDLDLKVEYDFYNSKVNKSAKPFFSSAQTSQAQNSYTVTLNLTVPIFNRKARGEKMRHKQEEVQAVLSELRLAEDIRHSVATAFRQQMELIDQLYYAKKAIDWYKKALKDEIARFKNGYGSLFIIIDFENRLRIVLIEEARLLGEWGKNIVELLYQTGTLIQNGKCAHLMNVDIYNYKKLLLGHGSKSKKY